LETIVARATEGLGVTGPVTARFYKLLVYDQGSFFVSHRDTEKSAGMFATLLVVLPSQFAGGELVVRHKGREVRLDLRTDDPAEIRFAAFYADCVHEVLPVADGCRLTLVYNLVRSGRGRPPGPPDYVREQARTTQLLQAWHADGAVRDDGPKKLVYPLEHAYTPAELGFAALKGADAAAAGVLAASAPRSRCDLHLALLTIEENGAAEYAERYGSRRRRWEVEDDSFEAGEVFDRSVMLSDWRRPDGGACAFGAIPVESEELSPPDACEDLAPDEEHFHEATGNEGASFERTYRRAALVLWPNDKVFAVLCQAGLAVTLPYLEDLVRRWAVSRAGRQSPLWQEAHNLAGHMLAQWPKQQQYVGEETASEAAQMLALLTRLGDTEIIESFLTGVTAAGCYAIGDNTAVLGALNRLRPPLATALVERIVARTAAAALGACAELLRRVATGWSNARATRLASAALRLIEALPGDPAREATQEPWRRPEVSYRLVVDLVVGLDAIDAALAKSAIAYLLAWPSTYDLDGVLIPALRRLVAAAGAVQSDAIEQLRTACVEHLRTRVAEPLAPPADWRRANAFRCGCSRCMELGRYLADPEARIWVLKAVEFDRNHVEGTIKQARCDCDTRTDKRGRPYSLVCTKNQASYERRARQRKQDLDDLARLAN
jgi:hypothetical protein